MRTSTGAVGVLMSTTAMADGIGVPTVRIETDFRAPSRLGDLLDWTLDVTTLGRASATVWTCDLTKGYIEINGDYRS